MKKIVKTLLIIMTLVLITGCGLKENVNLKVSSDKKVEFGYKILMDNELIDSILSMSDNSLSLDGETGDKKEYTDEERWKYLETENCDAEEGFTCEKVEEGKFKGFFIKKTFDSIDELTGTGDKINILEMDKLENPTFFKKENEVYTSNFEYNMTEENELSEYYTQMDAFIITFEANLPNKSISNNADTVSEDGLTLTWDLSKLTNKTIDFTFKFDGKSTSSTTTNSNSNNTNNNVISQNTNNSDTVVSTKINTGKYILVGVIVGVVLLIVIILIIVFASSTSKKKMMNVETETSKMFSTPINTSNKSVSNEPVSVEPVHELVTPEAPVETETVSNAPTTKANIEENNIEEKQN